MGQYVIATHVGPELALPIYVLDFLEDTETPRHLYCTNPEKASRWETLESARRWISSKGLATDHFAIPDDPRLI